MGETAVAAMFPLRKRWTREECAVMVRAGLIEPERYELIAGDLVRKVDKSHPHVRALMFALDLLTAIFGRRRVMPESPIDVSPDDNPTSAPEPDLAVLTRAFGDLPGRPRPDDIQLVVEISDTTLAFDLTTKARLYARAGIAEYWVVDIAARRVIVHREPVEGVYQSILAYSEEESVSALAAPEASIRAGDLF